MNPWRDMSIHCAVTGLIKHYWMYAALLQTYFCSNEGMTCVDLSCVWTFTSSYPGRAHFLFYLCSLNRRFQPLFKTWREWKDNCLVWIRCFKLLQSIFFTITMDQMTMWNVNDVTHNDKTTQNFHLTHPTPSVLVSHLQLDCSDSVSWLS